MSHNDVLLNAYVYLSFDLILECGNCGNLLSQFFHKNSVKITFPLKKILKS